MSQQKPRRELPVQRLIEWAFGTERAELELGEREPPEARGFGFGMEYVLIERAKLGGMRIDGSSGTPSAHEDAEAVAAVVSNLSDEYGGKRMARLIAHLGRCGLTPDWMPGAVPKLEPNEWVSRKKVRQGRSERCGTYVEILRRPHPRNPRHTIRQKKMHEIWWTPCSWALHPETIVSARAEYQAWREALGEVRDLLDASNLLRDHRVSPHLPRSRPWAIR